MSDRVTRLNDALEGRYGARGEWLSLDEATEEAFRDA